MPELGSNKTLVQVTIYENPNLFQYDFWEAGQLVFTRSLTTDSFSMRIKGHSAATRVRTSKNNHQVANTTPQRSFGPADDNYFWLSFVAYMAKRIFTKRSNEKICDLFVYGSWDLRVQR